VILNFKKISTHVTLWKIFCVSLKIVKRLMNISDIVNNHSQSNRFSFIFILLWFHNSCVCGSANDTFPFQPLYKIWNCHRNWHFIIIKLKLICRFNIINKGLVFIVPFGLVTSTSHFDFIRPCGTLNEGIICWFFFLDNLILEHF